MPQNPTTHKFQISAKDKPIDGIIETPKAKGPHPVVFLLHGFKGDLNHHVIKNVARRLTKTSLAAVRFNFRDQGSFLGGLNYFEDRITDLREVITLAKNYDFLDVDRSGLFGHSMGGITALEAAPYLDPIKVITVTSTPGDLAGICRRAVGEHGLDRLRKAGKMVIEVAKGLKAEIRYDFLKECMNLNVLDHALKINKPTLVIHGKWDTAVPFDQGRRLYKQLKTKKRFVPIYTGTHSFWLPGDIDHVTAETAHWFKRFLV